MRIVTRATTHAHVARIIFGHEGEFDHLLIGRNLMGMDGGDARIGSPVRVGMANETHVVVIARELRTMNAELIAALATMRYVAGRARSAGFHFVRIGPTVRVPRRIVGSADEFGLFSVARDAKFRFGPGEVVLIFAAVRIVTVGASRLRVLDGVDGLVGGALLRLVAGCALTGSITGNRRRFTRITVRQVTRAARAEFDWSHAGKVFLIRMIRSQIVRRTKQFSVSGVTGFARFAVLRRECQKRHLRRTVVHFVTCHAKQFTVGSDSRIPMVCDRTLFGRHHR